MAEKIIRDAAFAERLESACDRHGIVPPKHQGRLTWIQRELKARSDEKVSVETIRKWFAGEAKPRPDKLKKLSNLLDVSEPWLSLGASEGLSSRERVARDAMASGLVNVIAGLIQMDGGTIAYPAESDVAAKKSHIDLRAIIKGASYDLHIATAEIEDKKIVLTIPPISPNVIVLAVVRSGFALDIFEVSQDLIAQGKNRGGYVDIRSSLPTRITSFERRI